jgi:hypothetical protein
MAKRKSSLSQDVADLKDAVAMLIKHLTPQTAPIVENKPANIKKTGKQKKEDSDEEDGRISRVGASKKLKERKRGSGGTASSPKALEIKNRPNLFEKMMEFNQFKADSKIDKKLWKGIQPTPRGGRSTLVEAECEDCEGDFEVSPNELTKSEDDNGRVKYSYVCNDCLIERKGR